MCQPISFDEVLRFTKKKLFLSAGFLLRLAVAGLFLNAATDKLFAVQPWTATVYLQNASGPFAAWFQSMAGNGFVDALNLYGQLLIGLAFLFGCLLRPAAWAGALLMVLYYFANFEKNIAHGLIDEHVMYALVFVLCAASGFGHVWGIDAWLAKQKWVSKYSWIKKML